MFTLATEVKITGDRLAVMQTWETTEHNVFEQRQHGLKRSSEIVLI